MLKGKSDPVEGMAVVRTKLMAKVKVKLHKVSVRLNAPVLDPRVLVTRLMLIRIMASVESTDQEWMDLVLLQASWLR